MSTDVDRETKRIPVFCTAALSLELLQDFTQTTNHVDPEGVTDLPTIITTTNFEDACIPRPNPPETWLRPFLETGTPFLGWTPMEVRDLFIRSCPDDLWPFATFGILDFLSVLDPEAPTNRTILICSALPDFNEYDRVWLKTCRVHFEEFAELVNTLEVFVSRPSEIGKPSYLRFMPPLFLDGVERARLRISTGIDNDAGYSEEHLAKQGSTEGCVRYFVRQLEPPPPTENGENVNGTNGELTDT